MTSSVCNDLQATLLSEKKQGTEVCVPIFYSSTKHKILRNKLNNRNVKLILKIVK